MSLIVGVILVGINHGDRICSGTFCIRSFIQCLLTMLVPYTVSTVSSVMAMEECQLRDE